MAEILNPDDLAIGLIPFSDPNPFYRVAGLQAHRMGYRLRD
jgi:hypothetical protein